jgi:hypothetical protein
MIAYAEYIAYTILAAILLWTLGDVASDWYHSHVMRKHRERYWRDMQERMDYWAQRDRKDALSDREFARKQRRIRGEPE